MSNNSPLPSAPAPSYSSHPTLGSMPRRSSYASVVSGAGLTASRDFPAPAISNLMNPASTTSNYPSYPQSNTDPSRHQMYNMESYGGNNNVPSTYGRRGGGGGGSIPSYSRQYANNPEYNMSWSGGPPANSFFVPSYLRNSRYAVRLEKTHKAKLTAQKESASTHSSNPVSLSTSSSSVNLHRMAPSHRGMTYDIIEHHPPSTEDTVSPLPSRWNEGRKSVGLDIQGDGLEIRCIGPQGKTNEHEAAATLADQPMPPQCGMYYYEITVFSIGSKEGFEQIFTA